MFDRSLTFLSFGQMTRGGGFYSHILINLRILGPSGPEPGRRPCPAGTPTWVGFQ